MKKRGLFGIGLLLATTVGFAVATPAQAADSPVGGDAVVVAVIDTAFAPYHYDFLASEMPQAKNADASDDLPLDQPANTWLSGFDTSQMASFAPLPITMPKGPDDTVDRLEQKDAALWNRMKSSESSRNPHVYWMPGTKVIAAASFAFDETQPAGLQGPTTEHGVGTSSVSVGNLHGTCPECLAVLLTGDTEKAINWAMRQPWIDVITNSYGISTTIAARDRIYNGCALDLQKKAAQRGQSIFFSAGNGVENAFLIPNSTLFSCQEGPDWIINVGAVNSSDIVYVGPDEVSTFSRSPGGTVDSGRPADIASIGDSYPSAYESTTVSNSGDVGFSGTSNATPVTAGIYARALWSARQLMAGPSRTQSAGVVSVGAASCGAARPGCEVGDGKLSYAELRERLYNATIHTAGLSPGGIATVPDTRDQKYLGQGHGAFVGRLFGDESRDAENARIVDTMTGVRKADQRDPAERSYAVAVSYCSQSLWGSWSAGEWKPSIPLPKVDVQWPSRTALVEVCPHLTAPPREPYVTLYGDPEA
jgi:hypothetical protein